MDHPKTSGWPERIWRNANQADIARGIVPGEIVALTFKCDKAADVVGGFFGWTENV